MFQVTFSDQSMKELNQLPILVQMPIIEKFSSLSFRDLERGSDDLGKLDRGGHVYFRLRAGEYRIYFEVRGDQLFSHYILHRNTVSDFVFRMKLPYREESLVEKHTSFWKYLESLAK